MKRNTLQKYLSTARNRNLKYQRLCAAHEATHLVTTIALDGTALSVGIPTPQGKPPYNTLHPMNTSIRGGYANCRHMDTYFDGVIALSGYVFEYCHGDVQSAMDDYDDARAILTGRRWDASLFTTESFINHVADVIEYTAELLIDNADDQGVVHFCGGMLRNQIDQRLGKPRKLMWKRRIRKATR